ncbi:triose-phosphate isomerase, partial [Ralstonia pickettii]|nr:triose-phosphate isomerase [Ralstonia pickettii]
MRKVVIAGNWKMNKVFEESKQFTEEVVGKLSQSDKVDAVICAPFPYLSGLVEQTKGTALKVAAQNMHFEENGAYTGEVSPAMLKDIGVSHVIIGHSERREYFAETNETVNKKAIAAHQYGLVPIICVGETLEQREANETVEFVREQVTAGLANLTEEQIAETIIAYEPIWAIGTGKTASSEEANEVCHAIRQVVQELTNEVTADKVVI